MSGAEFRFLPTFTFLSSTEEADPIRGSTAGGAIRFAISSIITLFAGGWVGGRLAGVPRRTDSFLHGLVTWGGLLRDLLIAGDHEWLAGERDGRVSGPELTRGGMLPSGIRRAFFDLSSPRRAAPRRARGGPAIR